jgi:hypothetical protein
MVAINLSHDLLDYDQALRNEHKIEKGYNFQYVLLILHSTWVSGTCLHSLYYYHTPQLRR